MKGLTIFEVLVSILIFSIIALGLGYAVVAGKSALFVSDIPTQLRGNVLLAIMPMVRELRQAAPGSTIPNEGEEGNSITFKIPRYNIDTGIINWGNDIKYECNSSGQLIRTSGGQTLVITSNITTLLFSRKDIVDGLIKIDVTAQKADSQGKLYQDTEQVIVKMRN
jgi:hypothetical protein